MALDGSERGAAQRAAHEGNDGLFVETVHGIAGAIIAETGVWTRAAASSPLRLVTLRVRMAAATEPELAGFYAAACPSGAPAGRSGVAPAARSSPASTEPGPSLTIDPARLVESHRPGGRRRRRGRPGRSLRRGSGAGRGLRRRRAERARPLRSALRRARSPPPWRASTGAPICATRSARSSGSGSSWATAGQAAAHPVVRRPRTAGGLGGGGGPAGGARSPAVGGAR